MKSRRRHGSTGPGRFGVYFLTPVLSAISLIPLIVEADLSPDAPPLNAEESSTGDCPTSQEAVVLIQQRYDGIADFRAEFEQRTRAALLSGAPETMEGVSRGEVVFAKPGRMRWIYREPEPSQVISNGETLWIYDVGASQVTRMAMDEGYLAGAALQLLLGDGRLEEAFKVSPPSCGERGLELELSPREQSSYEKLSLTTDSDTGLVTSTMVADLFGNRTTILFSGVEINQSPESQLFEFAIPDGAEILDLSERP